MRASQKKKQNRLIEMFKDENCVCVYMRICVLGEGGKISLHVIVSFVIFLMSIRKIAYKIIFMYYFFKHLKIFGKISSYFFFLMTVKFCRMDISSLPIIGNLIIYFNSIFFFFFGLQQL